MKNYLVGFSLFLVAHLTSAQYYERPVDKTNENIGFGLGLDYGGVGVRATVLSFSRVDVFGGLGYNLAGLGWNTGLAYRFDNGENKVVPFANAMYGYNAVIFVENIGYGNAFKEIYLGPTVGGGIELHMSNRKNYFNFELLIPFRDDQYQKDLDDLKSLGVTFEAEPLPIGISVGFHIGL